MREADCLDFELLAAAAAGDGRTDGHRDAGLFPFPSFHPSFRCHDKFGPRGLQPSFFLLPNGGGGVMMEEEGVVFAFPFGLNHMR